MSGKCQENVAPPKIVLESALGAPPHCGASTRLTITVGGTSPTKNLSEILWTSLKRSIISKKNIFNLNLNLNSSSQLPTNNLQFPWQISLSWKIYCKTHKKYQIMCFVKFGINIGIGFKTFPFFIGSEKFDFPKKVSDLVKKKLGGNVANF